MDSFQAVKGGSRMRVLKINETCDRNSDKCANGAKCINSICQCPPGLVFSLSGWCEANEQTTLQTAPIITRTTLPTTKPSTLRSLSKSIPVNLINLEDLQTTTEAAKRLLSIGESCTPSDYCAGGSKCRYGRCECPAHTVANNNICEKEKPVRGLAKPGSACDRETVCSGGSICDSDTHTCICSANHQAVNGICQSKENPTYASPGEPCSSKIVCTGSSTCENGICRCDKAHFAEDGYCRPMIAHAYDIKFVNNKGLRFSSKPNTERPRAERCNPTTCKLPSCFCSLSGKVIPGGLKPEETPQFIVLTFDDAVNGRTFPDYKTLFENQEFKNPNGCPIKGTFFISHEWTNYNSVQWLVDQNMELASNSISHVSLEGASASQWLNEMEGQRRIMAKFAMAAEESITGIRAPQLSLGGDEQFEMMTKSGFNYDNSMTSNPGINGDPYWPQTLDHTVAWQCFEDSCPKSSFPGLWEIPLNQFYGAYMRQIDSYRRSSMIRAAVDLNNTAEELSNMFMYNFDRSYTGNRAPFVLSLNADFLQLNGGNAGMRGLQKFMREVSTKNDVYFVTMQQLIKWMEHPVPLSQISTSDAVKCPRQFHQNPKATCQTPNKCRYSTPTLSSYEHQLLTCMPCPASFPWLQDPTGNH